jgi:RNA polymerase sigma-70 factor, ECF subfamily
MGGSPLSSDRPSVPPAGKLVMLRASTPSREETENRIRALVMAGDVGAAVTGVLRLYGAEVYGFISALIEVPAFARDVYVAVGEVVWVRLPTFAWRCDLRTWIYGITRRAMAAFRAENGSPSNVLFTEPPRAPSGGPFREKAFRGVVAVLRRKLAPEDRELLILRVDRRLSWRSLAITSLGDKAEDAELAHEEERLRASLDSMKEKLAQIAKEHGILAAR